MTEAGGQRRLARSAGRVALANLLGGGSNLLLLVVLTRLLSRDDLAAILLLYLVVDLVGALGTLDLPAAMIYHVSKLGVGQARALATTTMRWLLVGGAALGGALFAAGPLLAETFQQPALPSVTPWLALCLVADLPGQALPGLLLARQASGAYFLTTTGYYALRFAGLVVPALLGASVDVLAACFAIASWARLLALLGWLATVERGGAPREGWTVGGLLRFSGPLALSSLVGKLGAQFDKYLLSVVAGPAGFAAYTAGAFELPLVSGIAYSTTNALMPELTRMHVHAELDAARTLWHAAMRKVAALLFPVFVFAFVMAEPLIRLLFSKTYADAAIPFRIFLCLLPLRLCGYGAVARAFGRSRPVLWGSLAAMATNLALAWPLWLALGLAGPALATILGQMVGIAVLLTSIRGSLRCRWSALLPCGPLARTLLVAGVSGVVLLVPHGLDLPDAAALAVGGPLYLLAYLCLGRLGGVITPADLRALATIFHLPVPRWIRPSTGS